MADKRMGRNSLGKQKKVFVPGETYLYAVGINAYRQWTDLNNAVRDAQAVSKLLQEKYGVIVWKSLYNEAASRKQVIQDLEELKEQVKAPDSLIIYYAGHGHWKKTDGLGYLVPADAERSGTDSLVANSRLRDFLQVAKAQHILFISDACFSGSLLYKERSGAEAMVLQELMARPSRWVICSGHHDEEVSDGSRNGHSPFAQALLDELTHNQQTALRTAALAMQVQVQSKSYYSDQLSDFGRVRNTGDKGGELILWLNGGIDLPEDAATTTASATSSLRSKNIHQRSEEEIKGIKDAIALTTRVVNKIREKLVLEDDPKREVRLEEQLKEEEERLADLKQQLQ